MQKKSAAKSSALGYVESIEYYANFKGISNDVGLDYNVSLPTMTDGKVICTKTNGEWNDNCSGFFEAVDKKSKGEKPTSATIIISSNGKVLTGTSMVYNGYTVNYDGKEGSIGENSNTPAEPSVTTRSIEITEDTMGTVTTQTNNLWSIVDDGFMNMGIWQSNVSINAYYKEKITVTSSRPATVTGRLALWHNCGSKNSKFRIGFSTTNDANKDSFTEYQEYEQNYSSMSYTMTKNEFDTFGQDFEVTIDEPGEYYLKGVYYMFSVSCSGYARLYDLKITQ